MVEVLDELELTGLVTTIPGLSVIGAAAMLAETGDPTRFDSPRALVKHAGLCPRRTPAARFVVAPRFRGGAGQDCDWPPGAQSGERYRTTR